MECNKILRQVCDDLAEDVNSEFCESLKNHLDQCENCRTEIGAMKNAVNLYKCLENKEVPQDIHNRLVSLLNVQDLNK